MNSSKELIRSIQSARNSLIEAAAKKASAGETIAEDVLQLERYDKIIDALNASSKNNWLSASLIGMICLITASLIWVTRISSVQINLLIESDAVTFQLAKNWQSRDAWRLGSGPLRLDGFSEIQFPPELHPESKLGERAWLDVDKAKTMMSNLELSAASRVSVLQAFPSTVNFMTVGSRFRGEADVQGNAVIQGGDSNLSRIHVAESIRFDVPSAFTFYSDGASAAPAQVRFSVSEPIILRGISIQALSFGREEAGSAGSPVFVSGVSSGTITISETNEKYTLNRADRLQLGELVGTIRELELNGKSLRLSLEGKAKTASFGPAGFEQNMVPTILSYLYHQERLSFFWGAIAFLWGLLWSARHVLLK